MRIDFTGRPVDEPEIRLGHIGCGGHSFRNVIPAFQFTPIDLVATCDLERGKAEIYARKFGARRAYTDYREMIEKERLDAVSVVVGFDAQGRPLYPRIAAECMRMGVHVFIEKPPSATAAEAELMMRTSEETGKVLLCGLKRMFFQTATKVKQLMGEPWFGKPMLVNLERWERIPTMDELRAYLAGGQNVAKAVQFLDHFCHPISVLFYLVGMPQRMIYHRAESGAGVFTFLYDSGLVANLIFTFGGSGAGGAERMSVIGNGEYRTIVVENCRVYCFQGPGKEGSGAYGNTPSYFTGPTSATTALWEPEFLLGQLYSKGLFLLGYYDEMLEFARSVLEKRQPTRGTALHCWQIAHMFEKMLEGPAKMIELCQAP